MRKFLIALIAGLTVGGIAYATQTQISYKQLKPEQLITTLHASTTDITTLRVWGNASTTVTSATTLYGALIGNVTGTASGNLVSGGTLTSSNVCQYDGSGIDCNLTQDGSGDCGAGAVCTGGHTHVGVNETYGSGWNSDTDTPEKDDVYDYMHLLDTDDDGSANNLDTDAVDAITEIAAALKDGSGDCSSGLLCLGDHTHSGYLAASSTNLSLSGTIWTLNAAGTGSFTWGTNFTINTIGQASTTALTVSGTTYLGTISGAINAGDATSFELPNGAAPQVDTAGEIVIDTTSDQLKYYGAATRTLSYIQPSTFTIASTTWASFTGTATSTIPLGPAPFAESWDYAYCFTDAGTAWVYFSDGTNVTNSLQASTTVGYVGLTANNTFTQGEKRYVIMGNYVTTPNYISCTIRKSVSSE